jgi:TRAP-type mannitol/chloroaromatic compound transport system permease small subunit
MTHAPHDPGSAPPLDGGVPPPHFDLDRLQHHTELPQTAFSRAIDPLVRGVGQLASWLWVALVAVITVNVLLRYVAGRGLIEFEELQWHIYAVGFLLGLAWVLESDDHVRIDVLHERWRFRTQCWVELAGLLLALLPFILVVLWYSVPFIAYSFRIHEVSEAPGGLAYRWAIKSFLFLGFLMLGLAALSRLTRVVAALFSKPAARSGAQA